MLQHRSSKVRRYQTARRNKGVKHIHHCVRAIYNCKRCAAELAGAHPGLQDWILLNYTRIENADKLRKKILVFCDV